MKNLKIISAGVALAVMLCAVQSCKNNPNLTPVVPQPPSVPDVNQPPPAPFNTFYALGENSILYELDISNPEKIVSRIKIETSSDSETIVAIDFRPCTAQLYALSNEGKMYSVNVNHNRISSPQPINRITASADFTASTFGFDFNPVTDRIRLVTNKGENLVLEPRNGGLDKDHGSPFGVTTPNVGAVAYTNNYSGASHTRLLGIDPVTDKLIEYLNAAAGELKTIGDLGIDILEVGGFDISPRSSGGKEYAIASVRIGQRWELHHVELETGKLLKLGDLPSGEILGIAIPTPVAYALGHFNRLLIFNPMDQVETDPERLIVERPITGLPMDAAILAIDLSVESFPKLYAIADNLRIYEIRPGSGEAREVLILRPEYDLPEDIGMGMDFNPFDNSIQVVVSSKETFNLPVGSRDPFFTTMLEEGKVRELDAVAYSNSQAGLAHEGDSRMYGISSTTHILYKKDINTNTLKRVGKLDFTFNQFNGFDIAGKKEDMGYGIFAVGGKSTLYEISLQTAITTGIILRLPYPVKAFTLGRYMDYKPGKQKK